MIAGNHDTPRTAETGCILKLFGPLGIEVVTDDARRISFPELDLAVLAVPEQIREKPQYEPDPTVKYNVLMRHGEIEGVLPNYGRELDRSPTMISLTELATHKWDYVALGHYHVFRELDAHSFYSGSIDYTSTNPWGELSEEQRVGIDGGKGFIEYDLVRKSHRFHSVPPERRLVDLPAISGAGLSPAALDEAIRDALDKCEGGIDNKIVRLVVRDVPRHIIRELDHKALREYKRRALHFNLDTRRPEIVRPEKGEGAPGRRASLADTVRDKLRSRPLTENIDREALVELGLHYLREADLVAGPTGEEAIA